MREELNESACAMAAVPIGPILLSLPNRDEERSNVVRVEFDKSACEMAVAPVGPIPLPDIFNVVRVELNKSACAMAVALVSPILLRDIFNVMRDESLRARRLRARLNWIVCRIVCSISLPFRYNVVKV